MLFLHIFSLPLPGRPQETRAGQSRLARARPLTGTVFSPRARLLGSLWHARTRPEVEDGSAFTHGIRLHPHILSRERGLSAHDSSSTDRETKPPKENRIHPAARKPAFRLRAAPGPPPRRTHRKQAVAGEKHGGFQQQRGWGRSRRLE